MAAFIGKVNRLVSVRTGTAQGRLRTGRITTVESPGVFAVVITQAGIAGENYESLVKWSRADPTTMGWIRT